MSAPASTKGETVFSVRRFRALLAQFELDLETDIRRAHERRFLNFEGDLLRLTRRVRIVREACEEFLNDRT